MTIFASYGTVASVLSLCKRSARLVPLIVLAFGITSTLRADTVTIASTVSRAGSLYIYSYAISETYDPGSFDVFLIDISVPKVAGSILDLTAPAGFNTAFDSGLGLVSFIEDSQSFTSAPLSGFSFESLSAPAASSFEATILNENDFSVITFDGAVTAPGTAGSAPPSAVTPEPSSLLLTASCLPLLFFLKRAMKKGAFQTERILPS